MTHRSDSDADQLRVAVDALVLAGLKATRAIPSGEVLSGCTVYDGNKVREALRAAINGLIALSPERSTDLPPRVQAAEQRAEFRRLLETGGLGAPAAKALIARTYREAKALPDRWVHISEPDLIRLFYRYQERRNDGDSHVDAVAEVLAEVDFEPSRDDLADLDSEGL